MAVRVFDGTDDEVRFDNNPNLTGALTIGGMVKRGVNTAYHAIVGTHNSGGSGIVTVEISSQAVDSSRPLLDIAAVGSTTPTTMNVVAADGWVLLIVTKASGNVQPRFHKYVVSTNTWTHENGGSALANAASHASGSTRFGEYQDTDDYNGKTALGIIVAGTAMSDAQVEALTTNKNVSDWTGHAVTPSRVWRLGDTTPTDLMGAGDTATINGTTVDTGDDPAGWTLGGGSSGATVAAVPAAATGDSPNSVITGVGDTTQISPAASGAGDCPAPAIVAGSVVTAVAATGLGSAPLAGNEVSSEVAAPAATGLDGSSAPGVSGTGGAEVVAVAADGTGASPVSALLADATVVAVVADGTGSSPAQTVSGELAALVTAIPADCVGYVPAPVVSNGTVTSSPDLWVPSIPLIPEIPVMG